MSKLLTGVQMKNFGRNTKYSGLAPFNYTPRGTDQELDCWLEYEAACPGIRERGTGLQMEPDEPARATLCYAEVNGNDIQEILSEETVAEIEARFLEQEEA